MSQYTCENELRTIFSTRLRLKIKEFSRIFCWSRSFKGPRQGEIQGLSRRHGNPDNCLKDVHQKVCQSRLFSPHTIFSWLLFSNSNVLTDLSQKLNNQCPILDTFIIVVFVTVTITNDKFQRLLFPAYIMICKQLFTCYNNISLLQVT